MMKLRMLSKIGFSLFVVLAVVAVVISSQPMHIGRAASGCQVTYTPNQWNNGFTAEVKITNNNTTAISGWTLTWSFANGQQITGAWNATVTQSGANVTASVPAGDWNGTIGANGGSVSFGFQATHTGTNAVPTNFVLNGVACNDSAATNTPTATSVTPTNTPTTRTPTPTVGVHPDLIVSGIQYVSGVSGVCVIPANEGTRVTVRNAGNANAGAFVVSITGTANAMPTATVSGLAMGAETTIFFVGFHAGGPTTAFADVTDVIDEISEDNNILTVNIPVPTGYPPVCTPTPTPTSTCTNTVIQAEAASFGGGAVVNSNNPGYTGSGFINFPSNGGYLQFNNVNGGSGSSATLRIRYALASGSRTGQLAVNGATQNITFTSTGSWSTWLVRDITISLNAGASNTIRFQSTGQDLANIDQIEVVVCGGVVTLTPTFTPTVQTPTPTPSIPTPTTGPGTVYTGNATYFDALGMPYGGCGITQSALDSQNFVALNVQNTPGDYSTMFSRPIAAQYADKIGMFNNGRNCGRWVRVTISDFCNGINDGAPGKGFCHDGTGWVADAYNGATLDMIVADSCQDSNGWCRDDPYHLDLAKASLNLFVKNGQPIGDLYPNHWNNRKITWQFIEAPNYTGDITIAFIKDAQIWWTPIAITHLRNGIHGVDYYENGAWVKATMNADMGQTYLIRPTTSGGTTYRIRVYDVNDQPINNGRIYNFSFPASCGTQCSSEFTPVTYTVE